MHDGEARYGGQSTAAGYRAVTTPFWFTIFKAPWIVEMTSYSHYAWFSEIMRLGFKGEKGTIGIHGFYSTVRGAIDSLYLVSSNINRFSTFL